MRVTFYIHDESKRICGWDATLTRRRRVRGSLMGYGNGLPHDLAQYVIEAAASYENGFWGLVARGATFESTGRRRTKPGRALIAEHRVDIAGSERLAGAHLSAWKAGRETVATAALDRARAQWCHLAGDRLVFEWPSPLGHVERTTALVP
ncbi:MAG TPA: hypothetical protein VIK54_09490 [Acidimicrobiia bacterium]